MNVNYFVDMLDYGFSKSRMEDECLHCARCGYLKDLQKDFYAPFKPWTLPWIAIWPHSALLFGVLGSVPFPWAKAYVRWVLALGSTTEGRVFAALAVTHLFVVTAIGVAAPVIRRLRLWRMCKNGYGKRYCGEPWTGVAYFLVSGPG